MKSIAFTFIALFSLSMVLAGCEKVDYKHPLQRYKEANKIPPEKSR
ncbi:MAG: hypothetical protein GQ570_10440 [Helicobacteraceae bacterium]|nr:hypothetical protein [Helicobacteraceae bacterium]